MIVKAHSISAKAISLQNLETTRYHVCRDDAEYITFMCTVIFICELQNKKDFVRKNVANCSVLAHGSFPWLTYE